MEQKYYARVLKFVLVIIVTVLFLFPIYWMATMAFKPFPEWTAATGKIFWVPNNPTLNNFRTLFTRDINFS
ncbi:hypothetical protein LCGC14_2730100, partial [marine sediment metagenome]